MAGERVEAFVKSYGQLEREVHKVIVGHDEIVDQVLVALFAGGHVLLEGVPGLGKTLLVRTLAGCLDLSFSRIQFTPDLMPADIIGTNIIVEDADGRRHFQFERGPVFAHILLADEVNRATPKTQSALLEAMQEASATVAGVTHRLPPPFFVLATQNPIEMEGTYPLAGGAARPVPVQAPGPLSRARAAERDHRSHDDLERSVRGTRDDRQRDAGGPRARARGAHRGSRPAVRRHARDGHPSPVGGGPGHHAAVHPLRGQPPGGAGARPRSQGAGAPCRAASP